MSDCCASPNLDGECVCYYQYCRNCGTVIEEADHTAKLAAVEADNVRLREALGSINRCKNEDRCGGCAAIARKALEVKVNKAVAVIDVIK